MAADGVSGGPVPDDASELDELRWQVLREEAATAAASSRRPKPRPLRFAQPAPDGSFSLRFRGFAVGVVVVVGCVLLALFASTFGVGGTPMRNPSPQEAPGLVGGLLPDGELLVDGQPTATADLRPAALIVPGRDCGSCQAEVGAAAETLSFLNVVTYQLEPRLAQGSDEVAPGATAITDSQGVLDPLVGDRTRTYLVAADGTIVRIDEAEEPEPVLPFQ